MEKIKKRKIVSPKTEMTCTRTHTRAHTHTYTHTPLSHILDSIVYILCFLSIDHHSQIHLLDASRDPQFEMKLSTGYLP